MEIGCESYVHFSLWSSWGCSDLSAYAHKKPDFHVIIFPIDEVGILPILGRLFLENS